jgi:hypothetical protein
MGLDRIPCVLERPSDRITKRRIVLDDDDFPVMCNNSCCIKARSRLCDKDDLVCRYG